MPDTGLTSPGDKQDDFLHHHSVSIGINCSNMLFPYLSFRTPQVFLNEKPIAPSLTVTPSIDLSSFPKPPAAVYMTTSSQFDSYSNQRTRNQFRPRNVAKGTSSYQLRQYAEATLGGGSLRKIVKLPEGEDENEWLAVNSMSVFLLLVVWT